MFTRSPMLLIAALALLVAPYGASAATLYLKSGTIDSAAAASLTVQGGQPMAHGSGYYLVALRGPVTESDKLAISAAGAELVEYVPDFAFVVRVRHAGVAAIRKLGCVDWVGPFRSEYKSQSKPGADGGPAQFVVTLFPGENPEFVLAKARMHGIKSISNSTSKRGALLRVLATRSQLSELTRLGAVSWVEPYRQPRLCNDVATAICGVPEVRQGLGLYGAGQIVGVADAGLDTGNLSTLSPDFAGRVLKAYSYRRPGEWSDLNGHGTHVVGCLLGSGALSGSNPAAHAYSGSFAGYAPEASMVFQSIGDAGDLVFPPLYLTELFQPAYDDGVRVHSDSWGSAAQGEYTTYSNQVDQFVWEHRDFTVLFPVGNDARDLDQNGIADHDNIYAPATAKNCIAVGATENLRAAGSCLTGYGVCWPADYPAAPIKYDSASNDSSGMAAFSGRGPTDDDRTKPDICAPGTNIISCRTQASPGVTGWSAYPGNANYIYWGGTSMSTPQVAGAAAIVREYYQKDKGIVASAALVKATLLAGADDMSPGQYGTGSHRELQPVPDVSQGWGRLNLRNSLFPNPPVVNEFADEATGLVTGETREFQYAVVDVSVPFVATLVWTDYPGAIHAAKELVNDLDLTVVSPSGHIYYVSGGADRRNNVERVRLPSPETGVHRVRVTGYNVPMGPQDFALVVSGGLPNTYISGTVRSTSGAGVQGVTVSVVSANGVKQVNTGLSGSYRAHVPPGAYSVQIGKPGWTFTPRSRVVNVTGAPVEGVDFQGQGAPGSLSGRVNTVVGGVTSHIVESPHPYLNGCDQTYVITAHQDATRVRVHFAEIDLMADGDAVYVLDSSDAVVGTYTGRGEDIWSPWVNGNVIKIRIVSNEVGNIGYGFYADGYETDLINQGYLAGAVLTLAPGSYQATSGADGGFSFASVPPGTYTITASKAHWKFQPAARMVEVPAGASASAVDFLGFPPGSITGEVRLTSSVTRNINIQSPHPYPDNYENVWQVNGSSTATRVRLHFAYISTEPAWDWVYLMDADENIIEMYTAEQQDLWTPWVDGNVAKIMLTSDSFNNYEGFRCDMIEEETAGSGLAGAVLSLTPGDMTATTNSQGLFAFAEVATGSHELTPSLPSMTFDPLSASLSISPGVAVHQLFYARMSDLTSPVQARLIPDGLSVSLKGVRVSAVFGGFFYVQDPSRIGGICVSWPGSVQEGAVVDVVGDLSTVNGERRITATAVVIK